MSSILRFIKRVLISIAIPATLFIIIMIAFPDRISLNTLMALLLQAIPPAILAWGLCFDIKAGLWDFSVGATVLISGIVGGNISNMMNLGVVGVIVTCSIIGISMGLLNGLVFSLLKIPSIIVTIGMLLIVESFSTLLFGGQGVLVASDIFVIAAFPWNVVVGVAAFILAYYLFNYTEFGFHVRAVGNGTSVAKMNGINITKVRIFCFATAGLFAGFFAFMQLGGSGVMKAQSNMQTMGIVLNAIICVVIALSLEKSSNLIIGAFIGSITTQIIKIAILVSGFPSLFQQVIIALFMLLFMGISSKGEAVKNAIKKLWKKKIVN